MKASILPIAKSAMKYFFDIDPVLTETVMTQAIAHGQLLQNELREVIRVKAATQRKTRIISLLPQQGPTWNVA